MNAMAGHPGYTFAYQPIVDVKLKVVCSFEALVRGPNNEPSAWVLNQFSGAALREFDTQARLHAITLAKQLGLRCQINLNLLPEGDDGSPGTSLDATLEMAAACGLNANRLVLEISEKESITDFTRFAARVERCRSVGVQFAIDDFGAGHSGLNLLAQFQPESIKLDMVLVRDIWHRGPRQAIVRGVSRTCEDLGIDVVAEGVETREEFEWLRGEGIYLFQGYFFAAPAFQALPAVQYPHD